MTATPDGTLTERCVDRWVCPHAGCGVNGQTQACYETETDLAAHERVCHPADTRGAER